MEVHAVVPVGTFTTHGVEATFWHLLQIEFVQELTLIALFTQAAQPMLAHDGLIATCVVAKLASIALVTGAFEEKLADLFI